MKFKNTPNTPHNIDDRIVWESRSVTVVGVIILYKDNIPYILASARGRNSCEPSEQGKMNLVAGYLDWDENGTEALYRECWEETGFNLPKYMKKFSVKLDNTNEPWSVSTDSNKHLQNVNLRYGIVLNTDLELPELTNIHNEIEYESENPIWLSLSEIDNYIWAYNHDNIIKLYVSFYSSQNFKIMYSAEKICDVLNIDHSKILNIYPYGSKIYKTDDEFSDSDFIIVFKSSLLPSGAFKDNAISSFDREVQGTCYSRSGFIDAINNYEISALECIFLPEDQIIQKKMNFGITKYNEKEFVKKIISKASSSWHFATLSYKDDNIESSIKNVFHALRILDFGIQIKKNNKIINYSSMNVLHKEIYNEDRFDFFNPYDYYEMFMKLSEEIKK